MDRGWWTADSAFRSLFLFRMLFAPSGDETWMYRLPRVTLRSPAAKYSSPPPGMSAATPGDVCCGSGDVCCGYGYYPLTNCEKLWDTVCAAAMTVAECRISTGGRGKGCDLVWRITAAAMGVPFLLLVYRCLYLRKCDSRLVGMSLLTSGWPLRALPWCIERVGPRKQAGYLTKLPL